MPNHSFPRRLLIRGLAAVLIAVMMGSSTASGAKKTLKVGFAQTGAESAWRTANSESMKSEAAKRGIRVFGRALRRRDSGWVGRHLCELIRRWTRRRQGAYCSSVRELAGAICRLIDGL